MGGLQPVIDLLQWSAATLRGPAGYAVASWLLALVFLWSGIAKLRRPQLTSLALFDFHVVRRPRTWQGAVAGLVEVSLGCALIVGGAMPIVLGLALALLLAFSLMVARSLIADERFPCACFGGEDELSSLTVARTCALAVLAGILLTAPVDAVSRNPLDETTYLALVIAGALLLGGLALSRVPRLLRWNSEVSAIYRRLAREFEA
jgi:uncharacterized membrane protein YphA (DoxX/SURF4 family)